MACSKTLMVVGVLLLASLLAEGDAQEKDQKTSADVKPIRPQTWGHGGWGGGGGRGGGGWGGGGGGGGGGWGGGGWGGGGGHGGGGRGGGCGGGDCGGKGGGGCGGGDCGGKGGGGCGGGDCGGKGGGGGCHYWCGPRCCTPEEIVNIKKNAEMKTEGKMTGDVKPETVVGTQGYGGGGGGGGGGWGGGGGGGGCRYWCGRHCCTPQEIANFKNEAEVMTGEKKNGAKEETIVDTQGYGGGGGRGGGGGYGGGGGHGGGGGWGGGGGGGRGGGGGGGCRYWCGHHCCTPEEIATLKNHAEMTTEEKEAKDANVGAQGYGGGGYGGGGGGCRYYCGRRCCTPEEIANNPELHSSEPEAKGKEIKNTESKKDPNPVKQGEGKN